MLGDAVSVMMMLIEGWMDAVVVMVLGCALERGLLPRCLQVKSSLVCVYSYYSRYNMCNHVQPLSRQPQ